MTSKRVAVHGARKATVVIGEPCVGKSTLMRGFMAAVEEAHGGSWEFRKPKHICFHVHEEAEVAVLGRYDEPGHQFPGTDRLSMGVQPSAVDYVFRLRPKAIVLEGDRLGNGSFIGALLDQKLWVNIAVLTCKPDELAARRALEREQSETFIRSRATKVRNLIDRFPALVTQLDMSDAASAASSVKWMMTNALNPR